MKRHHDMGGDPAGPVDTAEHPFEPWQKMITAVNSALRSRGFLTVDELRRHLEDLPAELYDQNYFARWTEAITDLLEEKELLTRAEVEARMAEIKAGLEAKK